MTTQAGWYPDPQDRSLERWWDGQQWTPATRGVSGGPVAAPRSNGPLLVVVGAVLVLAGLIVSALPGSQTSANLWTFQTFAAVGDGFFYPAPWSAEAIRFNLWPFVLFVVLVLSGVTVAVVGALRWRPR